MKIKLLFCASLLFISALAQSQTIENFNAEVVGDSVNITYDLIGSDTSQIFAIRLYSSINNYRQRLYRAQGDVGDNIKAGRNKTITWNNQEELTSYNLSDMLFSVDVTLVYSPIIFKNPQLGGTFKRGKTMNIDWIGGESFEDLNLELFLNNKKVSTISSISNQGSYNWEIPVSLKPGNGYQLKISRASTPNEGVMSPKFSIKRRIPTAYKVIPLAGLAVLAYFIFAGDGGGDTPSDILPPPANPQ